METQPPVQPISKVTEQYRQKGKGQNTEREQNGNAHGKLEKFCSRRSTLGRLLFVCSHCLCPELSTAFKCNRIQVFPHIDIVLFLFCFAKLLANINSCIVKVNLFVVVDICMYIFYRTYFCCGQQWQSLRTADDIERTFHLSTQIVLCKIELEKFFNCLCNLWSMVNK